MPEGINVLTIVVIAFLVFCAWRGYKKGFLMTVVGIVSVIVSLFAANLFTPAVTDLVMHNERVLEKLSLHVEENLEMEDSTDKAKQAELIEALPLPESLKQSVLNENSKTTYAEVGVDSFRDYVVYRVAGFVLKAIVFLVLFVIFRLLTLWIGHALDLVSRLPGLNELNRTAGLLAGALRGFLLLWVLCLVLTVFAATPTAGQIFAQIEESVILSKIYNNNLLLRAVTEIL